MDPACGVAARRSGVFAVGLQHRAVRHLVVDRIADQNRFGDAAGHPVRRGAAGRGLDLRRLMGGPP